MLDACALTFAFGWLPPYPLVGSHSTQVLKYLKRWSTTILPAFVITYSTVKWADWEFDQIHREHWD